MTELYRKSSTTREADRFRWTRKDNQDNERTATIAALQKPEVFQYASQRLRSDKEFVAQLCEQKPDVMAYATDRVRCDRELGIDLAHAGSPALQHMSKLIQSDKAVQYAQLHSDEIKPENWPTVRQALLEHPDAILNPNPVVAYRAASAPDPHYALAQHARIDHQKLAPVVEAQPSQPDHSFNFPPINEAEENDSASVGETDFASVGDEGTDFASVNPGGIDWESELSGFQSDFEAKKAQEQSRGRDR